MSRRISLRPIPPVSPELAKLLGVREISFTVPLVPPSVNHYVKHTRRGTHYVTPAGVNFKREVARCAMGRSLYRGTPEKKLPKLRYQIEVWIYLGPKQRGDGDNFWKCIGDGLKEAGVIHSDSAVDHWLLHKGRDNANPRTEIVVSIAG